MPEPRFVKVHLFSLNVVFFGVSNELPFNPLSSFYDHVQFWNFMQMNFHKAFFTDRLCWRMNGETCSDQNWESHGRWNKNVYFTVCCMCICVCVCISFYHHSFTLPVAHENNHNNDRREWVFIHQASKLMLSATDLFNSHFNTFSSHFSFEFMHFIHVTSCCTFQLFSNIFIFMWHFFSVFFSNELIIFDARAWHNQKNFLITSS